MMSSFPMNNDSTKNGKTSSSNWLDEWLEKNETEETDDESLDEAAIFQQAMQGVKPIKEDNRAQTKPTPKKIRIRCHDDTHNIRDVFSDTPVDDYPDQLLYSRDGITPDTLKKLRKGQFHIDNSIDLHGMTVDAARDYLIEFLGECETHGSRCVIIVHGKGYSSPEKKPVIKPMVNRWLREVPRVLAFCSAQPRDGGTGAVYVLLKKNK